MSAKPTLDEQIACARRELALREQVYPKWVIGGRMTQKEADNEIARMSAIVATLEWLERNRATIRSSIDVANDRARA